MNASDKGTPDQKDKAPLSERIAQWEKSQKEPQSGSRANVPKGGFALAGRVTTELVSGLVVGAFIGYWLDIWLETSPLMLVVMFFVGAVAGMFNVWRALTGKGMAAGYFDSASSDDEAATQDRGER